MVWLGGRRGNAKPQDVALWVSVLVTCNGVCIYRHGDNAGFEPLRGYEVCEVVLCNGCVGQRRSVKFSRAGQCCSKLNIAIEADVWNIA